MNDPTAHARRRRDDIDAARAFAALAVVLEHIPQYFCTRGLLPYNYVFRLIIQTVQFLHIPTFMLLAGMVLALSGRRVTTLRQYGRFVRTKLHRLMLPFVCVSLLHMAVKLVAPGEGIALGEQALCSLFAPRGGIAGHLWFLYCLMSIFLIWPLLDGWLGARRLPWLVAALVGLTLLPIRWPSYDGNPHHFLLGLQDLVRFLPIFAIGYWYGRRAAVNDGPAPVVRSLAGVAYIACWAMWCFVVRGQPTDSFELLLSNSVRLMGSVTAAFLILWTAGWLLHAAHRISETAPFIGRRSYDIYLLHVALVGHPLAYALAKLKPSQDLAWALFVPVVIVTYLLPIAWGEFFRRVPLLGAALLGIPIAKEEDPDMRLSPSSDQ